MCVNPPIILHIYLSISNTYILSNNPSTHLHIIPPDKPSISHHLPIHSSTSNNHINPFTTTFLHCYSLSPRTDHHHVCVLRRVLRDGWLSWVLTRHGGRQLPRGHYTYSNRRRGPERRRATVHRPNTHIEGLGVCLVGEERRLS